jgi:hypothetical protein
LTAIVTVRGAADRDAGSGVGDPQLVALVSVVDEPVAIDATGAVAIAVDDRDAGFCGEALCGAVEVVVVDRVREPGDAFGEQRLVAAVSQPGGASRVEAIEVIWMIRCTSVSGLPASPSRPPPGRTCTTTYPLSASTSGGASLSPTGFPVCAASRNTTAPMTFSVGTGARGIRRADRMCAAAA